MLVRSLTVKIAGAGVRPHRLAPIALSLLLLAGCSNQLGAAAVVDGSAISTQTIDSSAKAALSQDQGLAADNPANAQALIDIARANLSLQIQHDLLVRANNESEVPITDAEVSTFLGQVDTAAVAAELKVAPADVPARVKDLVVIRKLVTEAVQAQTPVNQVAVTVSLVQFDDYQQAAAARTGYLADPASFDRAVAEAAATEGQEPATGVEVNLHQAPIIAASGMFSASVGSLVLVVDQDATLVVRIDDRVVTKAPIPASVIDQQASVPAEVLQVFGSLLVAELIDDSDVEVNPRYGVWDPVTVQVVPGTIAL